MKATKMKNRRRAIFAMLTAAFVAAAGPGLAQSNFYRSQQTGLYGAKEASFDLFASYVAAERGISHLFEQNIGGGSIGGGVGVNYFVSPNLGIGTDMNIPNNGGSFVDSYTMNLIYRMPLGSSGLAPYISGGGGRSYDPSLQWVGQACVGLEYRSSHKAGVFVDGRYVWGEKKSTDNLLLRAGLRMVF